MTTATQEGVENAEVNEEVKEEKKTQRDLTLESLYEKRDAELNKELGIEPEPEESKVAEPEPEAEVQEEQEQPETDEQEPEVETDTPEPEKPKNVRKLKVDGQEVDVEEEKIIEAGIRALQKESAADKRLEEATRLLREVEARQQAVQQQPVQQEQPSIKLDAQTIAWALEHGDEEQKAYAVSQLLGRNEATPEQIYQSVEQKVLDTVDFRNASDWFFSEYPDIVKDPNLATLAAAEENRLRAMGDNRPRKELYKAIGDSLRTWRGGPKVESLEVKKEKKSKIVNIPSASARKVEPEEPPEPSASEVIAEMRKARGQSI